MMNYLHNLFNSNDAKDLGKSEKKLTPPNPIRNNGYLYIVDTDDQNISMEDADKMLIFNSFINQDLGRRTFLSNNWNSYFRTEDDVPFFEELSHIVRILNLDANLPFIKPFFNAKKIEATVVMPNLPHYGKQFFDII